MLPPSDTLTAYQTLFSAALTVEGFEQARFLLWLSNNRLMRDDALAHLINEVSSAPVLLCRISSTLSSFVRTAA